jgi:hypothetical protein
MGWLGEAEESARCLRPGDFFRFTQIRFVTVLRPRSILGC